MIMITIMTALMSMMTTRGAIMLMKLMMMMMMMMMMIQWHVKITMAYTHACVSAHVLCMKMSAIEAY